MTVLFFVVLFFASGGSTIGQRGRFEAYLNEKYGQDFVVEGVQSKNGGLAVPGQLISTAYPANDRSLVFKVGKSQATGAYFDGYSGAVWAREEQPRVESFLKTVYGTQSPGFDLTIHIPTAEAPDPIRGEVPSIDDALRTYSDDFYYSLTIRTAASHELSQDEIDTHADKMKQVIEFVLKKNVSYPAVRYAINIEDQDAGYLCNLSQDQLTDTSKISNCIAKVSRKVW